MQLKPVSCKRLVRIPSPQGEGTPTRESIMALSALPAHPLSEITTKLTGAVLHAALKLYQMVNSGAQVSVQRKADQSLVLNLDLASQEVLHRELAHFLPILSEEEESSHSLLTSEKKLILLDPLDGTTSCKRFLGMRGGQLGYGPMAGYLESGRLQAALFFHLPQLSLYLAVRGVGCFRRSFDELDNAAIASFLENPRYHKLVLSPPANLNECAVLFYPGASGELGVIGKLRQQDLIENAYRFGGFANDCCRLAEGSEQVQVQFSVKPWDLPAALFPLEAGLSVVMDPLGKRVPFSEWEIVPNNPLIICPEKFQKELLAVGAALHYLNPKPSS